MEHEIKLVLDSIQKSVERMECANDKTQISVNAIVKHMAELQVHMEHNRDEVSRVERVNKEIGQHQSRKINVTDDKIVEHSKDCRTNVDKNISEVHARVDTVLEKVTTLKVKIATIIAWGAGAGSVAGAIAAIVATVVAKKIGG